jgi:GNAT superfamily N-acetyltransferase
MAQSVTLRTAEETDLDFAYTVRERSMRRYVEQAWGRWNESETRLQIADDVFRRQLSIIEVNHEPAGLLRVDEYATHVAIDQLFLLPERQGQGIGTGLLQGILATAASKKLPVSLWVLRVNPALGLYKRLGFVVDAQTPTSWHLKSAA